MAVLWLILSVDRLHLLHLPPRQQDPSSITIHDERGNGSFSPDPNPILLATAPYGLCAPRSAVAITTCSGNEAHAFSTFHRAVLMKPLPNDPGQFKKCDRRRICRYGKDCSEGMHGVVTETSQKPRLGGDSTTWVARATGSVTAFACALFPHRNMAWEYLLDPAIDMLGHGDRMSGGKLIPGHHVTVTPKTSA